MFHGQPYGLYDVQLAPVRLQHVARGNGDLVAAADGFPDGVVLAGEAQGFSRLGEGDELLSAFSLTYFLAGGVVCVIIIIATMKMMMMIMMMMIIKTFLMHLTYRGSRQNKTCATKRC